MHSLLDLMLGKYLSFIVACCERALQPRQACIDIGHEMYPKRITSASINRLDETSYIRI